MPLTQLQAESSNIKNSLGNFLTRTVKTPYDIRAAATSSLPETYVTPLNVTSGKPDDPNIENHPPVVAIDDVTSTERDRFYEIGTNCMYRHYNFMICCYPSLNQFGEASLSAKELLESMMRNAMSATYIKILDATNGSFTSSNILYCNDILEVTNFSGPTPRGQNATLAQQKHRFDVHLSVRVVVDEGMVS